MSVAGFALLIIPAVTEGQPPLRLPPTPYIPMPQLPTPLYQNPLTGNLRPPDLNGTLKVFTAPEVQSFSSGYSSGYSGSEPREPTPAEHYERGRQFFQEGNYEQAVEEFRQAGEPDDYPEVREALMFTYPRLAQAAMAKGDFGQAFAAADALGEMDPKTGTLLKGDVLLRIGALPLAVEAYEQYADDENVRKVLAALRENALDRFRRRKTGDWIIYEPDYPRDVYKDFERPVLYMFFDYMSIVPEPYAYITVRPAPRTWSLGLAWSSLWEGKWPKTQELMEYRLTMGGANVADIVDIWREKPGDETLREAASLGYGAVGKMRDAETYLHEGRFQDTLSSLSEVTRIDWSFTSPQRHYGALVNSARAALELDEGEADRFRRLLFNYYPYWGPLAWAGLLAEKGRVAEAQTILEDMASDWPLRHEALEQLADIQWNSLQAAPPESRLERGLNLQRTLRAIMSRRPGLAAAHLRLAEWHLKLRAYAPTVIALKGIKPDTSVEAAAMLAALRAQGRDSFEEVGEFTNEQRGLIFRVYRSLNPPPAQGTVIHHEIEVLVLDTEGNHLETFALSTQAFSDNLPREYFLDHITPEGLQTLIRYKGAPVPSPSELGQKLAMQ
jgi:tetratricopeptide (TPR) repeat protein